MKYWPETKENEHGNQMPEIWGVINYTSDSFYAGSRKNSLDLAFAEAEKHIAEGADVLDIGAMSSRPGAGISEPKDEISVLLPLIHKIKDRYPEAIISIDTIHAEVAHTCVQEGAEIINDVTGGVYDAQMLDTVAALRVPIVIMHMRGTPEIMQSHTDYDNLLRELMLYFKDRIQQCKKAGIQDIILDPGFGFSKTPAQNMQLLSYIRTFKIMGYPVLIGLSRKSTIYRILDIIPEEALNGTTALHMLALHNGVDILRVHDVKEAREAIKLHSFYQDSTS